MTTRPRTVLAVSTMVTIGLMTAACGSSDTASDASTAETGTAESTSETTVQADESSAADSLTIYSGRSEELVQPILDRFEAETGIDVEVKYDDSSNLALLINEEATAGRNEADVYLSQSPGSMGFLEQNDRLAALPESTLDLVSDDVRDDDGQWIGITGRQRVLVYNTDLVDEAELPASVMDLIDERWKGQIGIAGSNGSFQDFVTAMRIVEGDDVTTDWLNGLSALDPVPYPKNAAIVAAVGRGEIEVGLVNHYYNFLALEENPDQPSANHVFAADDPGAVLLVTAAAVVEGTDRSELATQLIDFLLSEESQRSFAEDEKEYPLAAGVAPPEGLPELDFATVPSVDFDELEGGLERTRELIADAGLES
jgi:iron(III) transport system substrate-binding protein